MDMKQDVRDRVRRLDEQLTQYIPPRGNWNPADESLYKPIDLYRVSRMRHRAYNSRRLSIRLTTTTITIATIGTAR
ncbi:MAG TPA: hypothetical protein VEG44_08250 [Candidatus Acidoferrales bacterium]|nr:hypothetical protein [Candidatus Acidoferrales bacterium]